MLDAILKDGLSGMGLDPSRAGVPKLLSYLEKLLEQNRTLNLTAVRDPEEAVRLHLLDALSIFTVLDLAGKRVLDVGTGGGIPGAALALYEPEAEVTLLDATAKKLAFIRGACQALGVSPAFVNARAEEYGRTDARESYDVVMARAVAALPVLSELCLPLVKTGGCFVAYKGAAAEEELADADRAIRALGGGEASLHRVEIPGVDAARALIVIEKKAPTPSAYPRAFAQIRKRPL